MDIKWNEKEIRQNAPEPTNKIGNNIFIQHLLKQSIRVGNLAN